MGDTKISWASKTWNPVFGCSHVSDGCRNCYAEELALRFGLSKFSWTDNHAKDNVVLKPERVNDPLKWKKPAVIFVNSMSDLLHPEIPDDYIDQVARVMARATWHAFIVLTKRPERLSARGYAYIDEDGFRWRTWPPNVAWGVSVENQRAAEERMPHLMRISADTLMVSAEPLLEEVTLEKWMRPARRCTRHGYIYNEDQLDPTWSSADLLCRLCVETGFDDHRLSKQEQVPLHWLVVGGESGPNHRPMDLDWARKLRDEAQHHNVDFWFKQGSHRFPERDKVLDGETWENRPQIGSLPRKVTSAS